MLATIRVLKIDLMKSEEEDSLERIRKTQSELYARLEDLDRDIAALSNQHGKTLAPDEALESSAGASQEPVRMHGALAAAKKVAVPPPLPKSAFETLIWSP